MTAELGSELLREAAAAIREDYNAESMGLPTHDPFMYAVAEWLEHDATVWEEYAKQGMGLPFARRLRSLAVARAYLEEEH